MKIIQAIFVDVMAQKVSFVETPNTIRDYKDLMEYYFMDGTYLDSKTYCYYDLYGALKDSVGFFMFSNIPTLFVGNALLVGIDENSKDVSVMLSLEDVLREIKFISLKEFEEVTCNP